MEDDGGAGHVLLGCRIAADGRQRYALQAPGHFGAGAASTAADAQSWRGERSYADFLRLSHARKPTKGGASDGGGADDSGSGGDNCGGLPKKALKVLAVAAPWERGGAGWRAELIGSVSFCWHCACMRCSAQRGW